MKSWCAKIVPTINTSNTQLYVLGTGKSDFKNLQNENCKKIVLWYFSKQLEQKRKLCASRNILDAAVRILATEPVARRHSVKKVYLKISQNSKEKPVSESLF